MAGFAGASAADGCGQGSIRRALRRWLPVAAAAAAAFLPGEAVVAQQITEFAVPTPLSGPSGITVGPDGNLWFVETVAGKVGRITTSGVITEFPLPAPRRGPSFIAAGPDGNLWCNGGDPDTYRAFLEKVTPAGVVTEYDVTGLGYPSAITAGPDGNLWFGTNADTIVRYSTSGTATSFPVPTAHSWPHGITVGSDGALWFTELSGERVGRITTSGVVTEFDLSPVAGGRTVPFLITSGPDGALWFSVGQTEGIWRVDPGGGLAAFGLPRENVVPFGICRGRDGGVWFTEYARDANRVARIDPVTGVVVEYELPHPDSGPQQIVQGPDGALWFTEYVGNRIGRLMPAAGAATAIPAAGSAALALLAALVAAVGLALLRE